MFQSTAVPPAQETPSGGENQVFAWRWGLVLFAFLMLWLEIVQQLRSEWSLNPQYSYGWTVPFLVGWLFYQRWPLRPALSPARVRGLTITVAILAALLLLPARLIAIANPDWRLLSWGMALLVALISFCALNLVGGTPWLKHFSFPILFFLVAVPWPTQLEQLVIQSLMRADTAITIQFLNLFGTLAVQHGNVIELSTGPVGIDDACTGVRSLQATFMIALFLGEFYRLRVGRRCLLVVAGAFVAFACNIGRTFLLCEVAANSGIDAIHRWHDPAGYTILLVCLFALWGLSLWLKSSPSASSSPPLKPNPSRVAARVGSALPIALLVWLLLIEASAATWYSPARKRSTFAKSWSVTFPTNEQRFQNEPIPAQAQELLRYNEGGSATWRTEENRAWLLYSFRWLPGRTAALFVKIHRPDICLPASGLTMTDESSVQLVKINGVNLPLRFYRFRQEQVPLHVAYCYWDGRSDYDNDQRAGEEDWSIRGRLRAAREGKREIGARMLELAVWGIEDDAEGRRALIAELNKIVKPE
jgi:exosortase